jgi:hypothetical protein
VPANLVFDVHVFLPYEAVMKRRLANWLVSPSTARIEVNGLQKLDYQQTPSSGDVSHVKSVTKLFAIKRILL